MINRFQIMKVNRNPLIAVSIAVSFLFCVQYQTVSSAEAKTGTDHRKSVFLIPVPEKSAWQEFAYLATVPAAAKVNDGKPVVIAMNGLGSINRQVRHYLGLYKPRQVYVVGQRFEPVGTWVPGTGNVTGIGGGKERSLSAWVKVDTDGKGGNLLSWGNASNGTKWSFGIRPDGRLAVDIGGAFKAGTTDLRDGKWHHVGAMLLSSPAPLRATLSRVNLYVDGLKEAVGLATDKAASPYRNRLTGYWKMNEGFGSTSADSTDYNQTLDLRWEATPPGFGEGKFGKGLYLNGTGQRFFTKIFQPRDRDHKDTIQEISASVWVKPESDKGAIMGTRGFFCAKGGGWQLELRPGNRIAAVLTCQKEGVEYEYYNKSLDTTVLEMPKGTAIDQGWHHVAMTYKNRKAHLYVDGKRVASSAVKGIGITAFYPLRIGAWFCHGKPAGYLKGSVDEAAVWARELSEKEVSGLYRDGKGMEIDLTATIINTKQSTVRTEFKTFDGAARNLSLYDRELSDKDMYTLAKRWLTYDGAKQVAGTSASAVAAELASKFWKRAPTVVMCADDNYEHALSASCLAGRLGVPLLYPGAAANRVARQLGAEEIIFVGPKAPNLPPSKRRVVVGDAHGVLELLVKKGLPVEYFAVSNPRDRTDAEVKKGSLASVVLAVGRKGMVLPLALDVQWRRYCKANRITSTPPAGVSAGNRQVFKTPFEVDSKLSVIFGKDIKEGIKAVARPKDKTRRVRGCSAYVGASKTNGSAHRLLVDVDKDNIISADEVFTAGDIVDFGGRSSKRYLRVKTITPKLVEMVNATWQYGPIHIADEQYPLVMWETFDKTWLHRAVLPFSGNNRKVWPMFSIDLNRNGRFTDPGEGPHEGCAILPIGNRLVSVAIGTKRFAPGEFDATYPAYPRVRDRILAYTKILKKHPKYLCIVGMPDAIPLAILQLRGYDNLAAAVCDLPYTDTDSDPFPEMAYGRLVGKDRTGLTLSAVRALTYESLIGDPKTWARRALGIGWVERDHGKDWLSRMRQNVGLLALEPYIKNKTDLSNFSTSLYAGHGGPGGYEAMNCRTEAMLAPMFVDSGGACDSAGIDEGKLFDLAAPHLLDSGAIAYTGCSRPGGWSFGVNRRAMWNQIFQGRSQGEAIRYAMKVKLARIAFEMKQPVSGPENHYANNQTMNWYDLSSLHLFGDPAVKLYRAHAMKKRGPRVERQKDGKLRVLGPEVYWTHTHKENGSSTRVYTGAPGLFLGFNDIKHALAEWRTRDKTVVGIRQVTKAPEGFGMQGKVQIDEHQDGSRTFFWLVRFEEYDRKSGAFTQKFDHFDYEIVRKM